MCLQRESSAAVVVVVVVVSQLLSLLGTQTCRSTSDAVHMSFGLVF